MFLQILCILCIFQASEAVSKAYSFPGCFLSRQAAQTVIILSINVMFEGKFVPKTSSFFLPPPPHIQSSVFDNQNPLWLQVAHCEN